MIRAIRTQVDGKQEEYSAASAIHFDPKKDTTRQEDAAETDVNRIMERFAAGNVFPQRNPTYTEVDFGLDLQTALGAVEMARSAHLRLPRELREKYPTWQALLNGLYTGQFRLDVSKVPPAPEPAPQPNPAPTPAPAPVPAPAK